MQWRKKKQKKKPFGTQPSKSVHSRILTRIFPSFWPKGLSQVIMEDKLELLILFSTLKKCRNVDAKLSVIFSFTTKKRLLKILLEFSFQELTELFLTPIYARNLLWLEWFLASRRLFVTKNIFKKSLLSFTWFADRYLEAMEDGKVLSMSRYAMLGNIRTRLSNCTTSEKYNLYLNSINMLFFKLTRSFLNKMLQARFTFHSKLRDTWTQKCIF